jgi:hypothetical protein
MVDKRTHFGRAGEYFAMSELLLRGWNVAVPVVDVGDDAFVIDDRDKATRRVQVKTAAAEPIEVRGARAVRVRASFKLSREQLRKEQPIELFYMLMVRFPTSWRFLVVPREDLLDIRTAFLSTSATRTGPGRRPLDDLRAKSDAVALDVDLEGDRATGWGASLDAYVDFWPEDLWVVRGGPGSVGAGRAPDLMQPFAEDPVRSRDPER